MFVARILIRCLVISSPTRRSLNAAYLRFSPNQKAWFHTQFAGIFTNPKVLAFVPSFSDLWKVKFSDRTIWIPLNSEHIDRDWINALSIVGHDPTLTQTYQKLLESAERPEIFLDVGANFGTHSLLFLVSGVETVSFEPNSSCHSYFRDLCDLNQVRTGLNLEPVAIGDHSGEAELSYPETEPWLGSTRADVVDKLAREHPLRRQKVAQSTIDEYFERVDKKVVLMKIDTEGNEFAVLKGAAKTLREVRPKIVFECWPDHDERWRLYGLLDGHGYEIYHLPWPSSPGCPSLLPGEFSGSARINFIALPTRY